MSYRKHYKLRSWKEHCDGMNVTLEAASLAGIERQKLMIEKQLDGTLTEINKREKATEYDN